MAAAARARTQRAAQTEAAQLPTGRTAFLYNAVSDISYSTLGISGVPIDSMRPWFTTQGYSVIDAAGVPSDLMQVQNAAVFYMDAHGGFGVDESGNRVYEIATPILARENGVTYTDNIFAFYALLKTDEMGYHSATQFWVDQLGQKHWALTHYMFITAKFVTDYMSFAQGSLVFINGCNLMNPDPAAQAMVNAFLTQHAGVVLGWTDKVNAVMAGDTGLFLMDRLLGAGAGTTGNTPNGYLAYTATPANRPFSLGTELEEMNVYPRQSSQQKYAPLNTIYLNQSVILSWFTTHVELFPISATLNYQFNLSLTESIALAPTISAVTLSNNLGQLILSGDFGGSFTNRSVSIGGNPMPGVVWTDGTITINPLPQDAGGNILVTIDGAQSNHVLLNQWSLAPVTMITTNGPYQRTVTCDINLRASFDSLRQAPDQMPATGAVTTDNAVFRIVNHASSRQSTRTAKVIFPGLIRTH